MTDEEFTSSAEDETLARHRALAGVIDGKRPMEWSDWAIPIYDSRCLTPEGQRIALEAVEILRHALGANFSNGPQPRQHSITSSSWRSGQERTMCPGSTRTCFNWRPSSHSLASACGQCNEQCASTCIRSTGSTHFFN